MVVRPGPCFAQATLRSPLVPDDTNGKVRQKIYEHIVLSYYEGRHTVQFSESMRFGSAQSHEPPGSTSRS